jgi:hypothetical protein
MTMTTAIFGKPELYGVELTPHTKPAKREVHVTGYVTVEIVVDRWIEVDGELSDEEIKDDVMSDIDCGEGEIERASQKSKASRPNGLRFVRKSVVCKSYSKSGTQASRSGRGCSHAR